MSATTLHAFLAAYESAGDGPRAEIAEVIRRLADAAIDSVLRGATAAPREGGEASR